MERKFTALSQLVKNAKIDTWLRVYEQLRTTVSSFVTVTKPFRVTMMFNKKGLEFLELVVLQMSNHKESREGNKIKLKLVYASF
jgi:hypothetical protein